MILEYNVIRLVTVKGREKIQVVEERKAQIVEDETQTVREREAQIVGRKVQIVGERIQGGGEDPEITRIVELPLVCPQDPMTPPQ